MEKDVRVLSNLIENLEEIKGKLSSVDYGQKWINCILPKKNSRSYINIKNVLESLVMKTVEGKGYDEDIASFNQQKPFLEKNVQCQKLFSSEDFLSEATNFPKMPLKFDSLHNCLTNFQDFLGDILHSVCQISSCQLKLPSKILIKDLLKLKNQYLSIWDLISSVFSENKCRRDSECSFMDESKSIKSQISELQKCLQKTLKEMAKVKLEIEHYVKCSLIEMQFTNSPRGAVSRESVFYKEEVVESNTESEYSLPRRINSTFQDMTSNNKMTACDFSTRERVNNLALSSSSMAQTEARPYQTENNGCNNSQIFSSNSETWNDISNSFFHKPNKLPTNILYVDPTTVLIESKNDAQKRNSLPKIYSVDSFSETMKEEPKASTNRFYKKIDNSELNEKSYLSVKVENVKKIPQTKNQSEENLFKENKNKSENQTNSYSYCLREKLSSMFNMLESSETIQGEEDIFEETPLKIERSDFSFSQTIQNYKNLKFNTNKENVASNVFSFRKSENKPKTYPDTNTYQNKTSSGNENKETKCIIQNKVNYEIPFYFGGSKKDYNNVKPIRQTEEVIYDKQSVIELFQSKEAKKGLNTGSTTEEYSRLSLWPVTAEYIHVSKRKRLQKCDSMSSDNSIPLSKSLGKSYYSLHLNKRYEQKQFYDGDLLVLENPDRPVQQASSSNSLLNQSYSVFNQEENYKPYKKTNYAQNNFCGKFNNKMQLLPNKNLESSFKKEKKLNNNGNSFEDVKKTLAVHYKDCEDSFQTKNKKFKRENFDFLKVNGFDNNNNWNSFISIFTSKVGPTAQINHHKMFRKVINTFTSDSLTCSNVFGNVHTLTSNGGPFRLFDINGYPLTDSTGNVLKDPYGKSIVTLDSTGFPKDDIKVFDAAGNSPNDINFDPTQKPKTNSIIIKLTDNFKRPLHLFDKYGRPLTDSCGKLLVNIHGRPLLRFDNFGRPNTDFRGGPLYTDNGYRWSHKTGDFLSSNQISNESLTQKKLCGFLKNESMKTSSEKFGLQNKCGEKNGSNFDSVKSKTSDDGSCPIMNPSESDIWMKVENVLQKFPMKKKIEPKASRTNVIVNNVTITQNPFEKEFLKSIIYHNNIIQQDVNHFNRIQSQPFTNQKTYFDIKNLNSCLVDTRMTEHNKKCSEGKELNTDLYKPYFTMPLPFQNNIFEKSVCFKYLNFNHLNNIVSNNPIHLNPIASNKFLIEQSCDLGKAVTRGVCDPIVTALPSYPNNSIKDKKSYLTFKNHDYLNSLCNNILKHEINYSNKTKHTMNPEIFKKNNDWTDTSNTIFPSSIGSRYTTGFSTQTESPVYFSDTSKYHSEDLKTQNKNHNCYFRHQQPLEYDKRERDVLKEDKYFGEYYQTKNQNSVERLRPKSSNISNEQLKDRSRDKSTLLLRNSNKDNIVSVKVLNKENKHYEIKVTEMLSRIINPKLNFGLFSSGKNNNDSTDSPYTSPKKEIDNSSKNKNKTENSKSKLIEKNHPNTENYKEKLSNSLFRFSSDDTLEPAPTSIRNNKRSYVEKAIGLDQSESNLCKDSFKFHQEETKHLTNDTNNTFTNNKVYKNENNHERHSVRPLTQSEQSKELTSHKKDRVSKTNNINTKNSYPVKKPVRSSRECNLASFFGSPVKYVLNKLDGKRSLKPNKTNSSVKKKAFGNSKENAKKSSVATYPKDKIKPINSDIKIKTLYDITKSSKKSMLSSSEKAEIRKHKNKLFVNEPDTLLAFRSKSCTSLVGRAKNERMCYSGDSRKVSRKKLSQRFPSISKKLRRSTSVHSYITVQRSRNKDSIQISNKYERDTEKPTNEQNSCKPNTARRKCTELDYRTQKSSKSRKESSGRHKKSSFISSRTKAREISLFKKVEPEGKYMLKIKK